MCGVLSNSPILKNMMSKYCIFCLPCSSDDEDEFENSNTIWISQDELIEHVNVIGCTLDLPPFSLSSTQASQLVVQKQNSNEQRSELASLQESYNKLEEEYKKYRVDMGIFFVLILKFHRTTGMEQEFPN